MNDKALRETLIAGLMNPRLSPVIDFEKSSGEVFVYGCDRAHATRLADRIIKEGSIKRALTIMSDESLRNNVRKLNIEDRIRKVSQLDAIAEQERALIAPRPVSDDTRFSMRGGQPGSWFDANESAYDGGVSYRQSGAPVREQMEQRVKSAFAKN
jgi:hypothetical protein